MTWRLAPAVRSGREPELTASISCIIRSPGQSGGKQYVGVYSGIGGWIGLPVTAGLDLGDKFGAIGATAMTKAAGLQFIPQGGELNVFRLME